MRSYSYSGMVDNYEKLDELTGEQVKATVAGDREIVGTLDAYEDDFALTLAGDGQPEDVQIGDMEKEYVDGEKTLNGSNVISVEEWERP